MVEQALGHGDEVTAVVRDPSAFEMNHLRLVVVDGDVRDLDSMRAALAGHDAVLSAIGAEPGRTIDLYSEGIGNVLHAMAEAEVGRLVVVSAAGTFHRNDKNLTMGYKLLVRTALKGTYDDLERMEQRVMASGMNWTIVCPSGLTDGPFTGEYRVGVDGRPLKNGRRISRADVAAFALKTLGTDRWSRKVVAISS